MFSGITVKIYKFVALLSIRFSGFQNDGRLFYVVYIITIQFIVACLQYECCMHKCCTGPEKTDNEEPKFNDIDLQMTVTSNPGATILFCSILFITYLIQIDLRRESSFIKLLSRNCKRISGPSNTQNHSIIMLPNLKVSLLDRDEDGDGSSQPNIDKA